MIDYAEKFGIKQHHEKLLEILIEIEKFCRSEGIVYTIDCGTLLGAVRHHDFIPWDDDADIMMQRVEFDRFMTLVKNSNILNCTYYHWIPRVYLNSSDLSQYEFIDLFAMDWVPDQPILASTKKYLLLLLQGMMHESPIAPDRSLSNNLLLMVSWTLGRLLPQHIKLKLYDRISRIKGKQASMKAPYNKSFNYVKNLQKFMPECFETFFEIEMCGHTFMALTNYQAYLTAMYGDYMKLPPEEKRKPEKLYAKKTLTNQNALSVHCEINHALSH